MAVIDGLGLQEPSTITKSLAVIPITRNSSVTYQEIMSIGSPNSTGALALAEVLGSAPASTVVGLAVRQVGPITIQQSTASDLLVNVSSVAGAVNMRSSAANALVTVYQSTASDLNVNVSSVSGEVAMRPASTVWASSAGFHFDSSGGLLVNGAAGSTTVNVSSLGGAVIVRSSAANALMSAYQSTAADLQMTATFASSANSVLARITTSSGGGVEGSTILPQAAGILGLHVRPVFGTPLTVAQSTVGQTTATVLISSAATTPYVSGYVVTSTEAGPITGGFYAGSTLIWPVTIWADGGVPTQMMSVAQPAYVFRGQASRPLEYRLTGTTGTLSVALTYWTE